jgi:hypothetical protein
MAAKTCEIGRKTWMISGGQDSIPEFFVPNLKKIDISF